MNHLYDNRISRKNETHPIHSAKAGIYNVSTSLKEVDTQPHFAKAKLIKKESPFVRQQKGFAFISIQFLYYSATPLSTSSSRSS